MSTATDNAALIDVLVVSPDAAVASTVANALSADYQVVSARDAHDATVVLDSRDIGVMLCDEALPQENGLVFMLRIRERFPLLQPVLMSEGITEDLIAFAINDVGVLKYLKKPLIEADIAKAVTSAQAHHAKAVRFKTLQADYQRMTREMHGLPYRVRRFRRSLRVVLSHSRDFVTASATTVIAINGLMFGLGVVVLGVLYAMKSLLGINVLAELHLEDLLF